MKLQLECVQIPNCRNCYDSWLLDAFLLTVACARQHANKNFITYTPWDIKHYHFIVDYNFGIFLDDVWNNLCTTANRKGYSGIL